MRKMIGFTLAEQTTETIEGSREPLTGRVPTGISTKHAAFEVWENYLRHPEDPGLLRERRFCKRSPEPLPE